LWGISFGAADIHITIIATAAGEEYVRVSDDPREPEFGEQICNNR
jgi:hypothetical protein